ncbi:MAG: hypothetical protein RL160_433 [Bacteroidota bacterium]|jgi:AcrR family transcriptional regulator
MSDRSSITQLYIEQVLETGTVPTSVFSFCKKAGIAESDFYGQFSSLEHLRDSILASLASATYNDLKRQESFRDYGFREQVLAYFFAFTEGLLPLRSYMLLEFGSIHEPMQQLRTLKAFRKSFMEAAGPMIDHGVHTGVLKDYKFQKNLQQEALWLNLLAVCSFWLRDKSSGFEDTDAMIEKSVHLSLNLLEQNTLDKAIDLGRFLIGKASS